MSTEFFVRPLAPGPFRASKNGKPEGLPLVCNPKIDEAYLPDFAGADIGAVFVPDNTEWLFVVRS